MRSAHRTEFECTHPYFPSHIHSFHHIFIIQIGCHRCGQERHHNHSMETNWSGSIASIRSSARVHTILLWCSGYSQMQCIDNNDKFIPTHSFPAGKQAKMQACHLSTWSLYRHDTKQHRQNYYVHSNEEQTYLFACTMCIIVQLFKITLKMHRIALKQYAWLSVCLPMSFTLEQRSETRTIKYIFFAKQWVRPIKCEINVSFEFDVIWNDRAEKKLWIFKCLSLSLVQWNAHYICSFNWLCAVCSVHGLFQFSTQFNLLSILFPHFLLFFNRA